MCQQTSGVSLPRPTPPGCIESDPVLIPPGTWSTLTFTSRCLTTVSFPPDSGTTAVLSVHTSFWSITSAVTVKFTFPREQKFKVAHQCLHFSLFSLRLLIYGSHNRSLSLPDQSHSCLRPCPSLVLLLPSLVAFTSQKNVFAESGHRQTVNLTFACTNSKSLEFIRLSWS